MVLSSNFRLYNHIKSLFNLIPRPVLHMVPCLSNQQYSNWKIFKLDTAKASSLDGVDEIDLVDGDCRCDDVFQAFYPSDDFKGRGRFPYISSRSYRRTYLLNKILRSYNKCLTFKDYWLIKETYLSVLKLMCPMRSLRRNITTASVVAQTDPTKAFRTDGYTVVFSNPRR